MGFLEAASVERQLRLFNISYRFIVTYFGVVIVMRFIPKSNDFGISYSFKSRA